MYFCCVVHLQEEVLKRFEKLRHLINNGTEVPKPDNYMLLVVQVIII